MQTPKELYHVEHGEQRTIYINGKGQTGGGKARPRVHWLAWLYSDMSSTATIDYGSAINLLPAESSVHFTMIEHILSVNVDCVYGADCVQCLSWLCAYRKRADLFFHDEHSAQEEIIGVDNKLVVI